MERENITGVAKTLIVGGGIGGMAAAIALAERGVAVDLIDLDPQWRVYGAGITITGPTLRAYRRIGLLDQIKAQGAITNKTRLFRFDGTHLKDLDEPVIESVRAALAVMAEDAGSRADATPRRARAVRPRGSRLRRPGVEHGRGAGESTRRGAAGRRERQQHRPGDPADHHQRVPLSRSSDPGPVDPRATPPARSRPAGPADRAGTPEAASGARTTCSTAARTAAR